MLKKYQRPYFLLFMIAGFMLFLSGCGTKMNTADLSTSGIDKTGHYDLIVIGSDPEGITAAIAGARNGLKTALIDFNRDKVGGLYTLGWLNMIDLNYVKPGSSESINTGIFSEVHEAIGKKSAFDVDHLETVFNQMLIESGVVVYTKLGDQWTLFADDHKITGLQVNQGENEVLLTADTYIDATQNADIARSAGVFFYDGEEQFGLKGQRGADTLVFKIDNVDWQDVYDFMKNDGIDGSGADATAAWGYQAIANCKLSADNMQIRGPNLGLQNDGTILVNGLQLFQLDLNDSDAYEEAKEQAKTVITNEILPYMAEHFPGWENAVLVDVAPEFYIRESYHMDAVKILTGHDVFESIVPEDTIAEGAYSIDLQAREKGLYGISLSKSIPYGIPFGVLVPKTMDNLMVVGKAGGYDVMAFGSARTVPVGMSLGQAAGTAAALAKDNGISSYRAMAADMDSIRTLRSTLEKQGVVFHDIQQTEYQKEFIAYWAYPYVKDLRDRGLIAIGGTQDYALDEEATRKTINNVQYGILCNSPYLTQWIPTEDIPETGAIDSNKIAIMIASFLSEEVSSLEEYHQRGILDETIYNSVKDKTALTNGEIYSVCDCVIKYMEAQGETYYREDV